MDILYRIKKANAISKAFIAVAILSGIGWLVLLFSGHPIYGTLILMIAIIAIPIAIGNHKAAAELTRKKDQDEKDAQERERLEKIKKAEEERMQTIAAQKAAEAARHSKYYTRNLEVVDSGQKILARIYKELPPYEYGAKLEMQISEDIIISTLGEKIGILIESDAEKVRDLNSPKLSGYIVDEEIDAFGKTTYTLSVNIDYLNE